MTTFVLILLKKVKKFRSFGMRENGKGVCGRGGGIFRVGSKIATSKNGENRGYSILAKHSAFTHLYDLK